MPIFSSTSPLYAPRLRRSSDLKSNCCRPTSYALSSACPRAPRASCESSPCVVLPPGVFNKQRSVRKSFNATPLILGVHMYIQQYVATRAKRAGVLKGSPFVTNLKYVCTAQNNFPAIGQIEGIKQCTTNRFPFSFILAL